MKEYRSAPIDADTVVVFVHGIIEGPDQFQPLVAIAEERGCAVENLLLPGHGGDGKAFAKSGRIQWEQYLKQRLDTLRRKYQHIRLVGHSMGTLLELQAAAENPEKISSGFFLAMPLRIRVSWRGAVNGMKVALNRVSPDDTLAVAAKEAYGIQQKFSLRYLTWIPRYLELFSMSRECRSVINQFPGNMWVFFAKQDEFVSQKSQEFLRKIVGAKIVKLPGSGHFYYTPEDWKTIEEKFICFLEG